MFVHCTRKLFEWKKNMVIKALKKKKLKLTTVTLNLCWSLGCQEDVVFLTLSVRFVCCPTMLSKVFFHFKKLKIYFNVSLDTTQVHYLTISIITHITHQCLPKSFIHIYDTQLFKYTLNNIEIAYFKGMSHKNT